MLLSIKPEFAEKIFSGEKRIEFRKKMWKNYNVLRAIDAQKIYLYVTAPVKRIRGYFKYDHVRIGNPSKIWKECNLLAGITKKEFQKYFMYKDFEYQTKTAFAIRIKSTVKFNKPINPRKLSPGFKSPQNYYYLNNILETKLFEIEKETRYKNLSLENLSQPLIDYHKVNKKKATK